QKLEEAPTQRFGAGGSGFAAQGGASGIAHDQLRVKTLAVYLIVSVITVADTVDQQCRRPLGDSPVWLLRGGQVRPGLPGERAVLKPDDRQLVRHIYALDPRGKQCACGNLVRSEEHTSELQSRENLVCRLLLEKKKKK